MPAVSTLERLGVGAIRDTIRSYRDAVRAHAVALNRLNVYPVPDGDTGTNMASTLDAVIAALEGVPLELRPTCHAIAHGSLMGARGNSGVILSQILRGLSGSLEEAGDGDPSAVATALAAAATAAYAAVLRPIEGTILTVVREAAAAAELTARTGGTLVEVLAAARARAHEALERTPELLPVLKAAGVVDAGGAGFVLLLDAALHVVDGRPVPEPVELDGDRPDLIELAAERSPTDVDDLRYEVMYFLDLPDEHIDGFKDAWGSIGDSIVVVGGDGFWNCHVHTNDVGAAIEVGLGGGGRPSRIRVTDLTEEVGHGHIAGRAAHHGTTTDGEAAVTVCAVVAVGSGHGLHDLFHRLGVARVVGGGQAMNPSTAELLTAVNEVLADQVVVLPNNKNVIPVAEQIAGLTAKRVVVVPTRSAAEALVALVAFDPAAPAEANAAALATACDGLVTGVVTRAVPSARSSAGPIATGDWLGLVGDDIVAVAPSLDEAALGLLAAMVTDGHEVVIILEGAGAASTTTAALSAWLAQHRPRATVEVHRGDQPLEVYVVGAE